MKRRLLPVLLCSLAARTALAATCSPTTFITAATYPAPNPAYVGLADFNGDGFPDIATTSGGSTLTVLLNQGDGTFGPPSNMDLGTSAMALVAVDLRGNGTNDLVTSNYGGVNVLLGHGDGTFDPPVYYPSGGYYAGALVVGKFDANGTMDVAVAINYSQAIVVFPGNGDGTLATPVTTPAPGVVSLVAGDFNGDGKLDLVSANGGAGTISFRPGLGNGGFGPASDFIAGSNLGQIVAADFDGDGNLDVAVTSGALVAVLLGNGDGAFQAALQYAAGTQPTSLAAADFDQDGVVDLVTGDAQTESAFVLPGTGTGAFGQAVGYLAGATADAIAVADLNGDSLPDVVAANGPANTVTVLEGAASGTLRAVPVSTPVASPQAYGYWNSAPVIARGDWNGDGRDDLAWPGFNQVVIVQSLGEGRFAQTSSLQTGDPNNPQVYAVGAADFDGDGLPDLAASDNSNVLVFRGLGNGSFAAPQSVYQGYSLGIVGIADLNGDGKKDLAVMQACCGQEPVLVLLGNGDGTFQPPLSSTVGFDSSLLLPGDFNRDAKDDLVAVASSGVYLLVSNGDGTVQPPLTVASTGGCCVSVGVASGHFFGAALDLLVTQGNPYVSLYPGNGDGTFGAPVLIGIPAPAGQVAAGDFDGDGHDDFAVVSGGQIIAVFLGLGNGHFQTPAAYPAGPFPVALESGNFTGSGALDVALISQGSVADLVNARLAASVGAASTLVGSPAVLRALASGFGPISYQWRKGGVPLSDGGSISGATTATLTIDPAAFGDAGSYDVLVTDSCTTVASNAATLSVEFADVPTSNIFHDDIIMIATAGVTAGCGGADYCPTSLVTRAQMAVFLLKSEHGSSYVPPACTGIFTDVPCPGPFADWIEQLANEGVTAGCGGNNYCPDASITRAQMAVFLLKTSQGSSYVPPPAAGIFGDVPVGSFAADWIEDLYDRGIAGGCSASPLLYCPNNPVNRAQMAAFLVNTFF